MFEQLFILLADPVAIGVAFGAVTLGVILGALPGLTGPMAMALLIGVSYSMKTEYAIVAMMLIYMAGAYGGSMSAILLNVPGAPASAGGSSPFSGQHRYGCGGSHQGQRRRLRRGDDGSRARSCAHSFCV